ncbi:MAG: HmuY family protein [Chitinophagales bacterium]|nr:HmuY family protein [Chitinophagales bacterium]MDW8428539.1 HmuY family protein [Chitinophagales bacterium]
MIRFISLLLIVAMTACFREDEPVVLPPPGELQYAQVAMGSTYGRQYYFDLETRDTTGMPFSSWDLCFSSTPQDWQVWINGGNQAYVALTTFDHLSEVKDTTELKWLMDAPSWHRDSTAIGAWMTHNYCYVLDRGPAFAEKVRYYKFQIRALANSDYLLTYAALHDSAAASVTIERLTDRHYLYFSFDHNGSVPFIEPAVDDWDLLFTRYRHVFTGQQPPLPYVVTGVLINPSVAVAVDSILGFDLIDYAQAQQLTYVSQRNIIGYAWKYYDFSAQAFIVRSNLTYVIRDTKGIYWKLRFIDFYNENGEKGYPAFAFQRL